MAADTQGALLDTLRRGASTGTVTTYRPFWIANAVAVQAAPAFLEGLAKRPDVASVYLDAPIELVAPVAIAEDDGAALAVEGGITSTRAPELWALGIDGTGALACDQDTGADATHPAFAARWRGLDAGVAPGAAWFDPVAGQTFPTDSGTHGTHTLGTMVGRDGANQIGMAPGAKWIGAKVIDVPGANIYTDAVAAFQWMTDPDGNPATVEDVPDAVNNSWGLTQSYYGTCRTDFNAAIQAAEAAGVVVAFAAGNDGSGAQTMGSPANQILSALQVFSVGALKQGGTTIASFSSRGPSDCDGASVKPEVVAVGENVRSAKPGGAYQLMSGTSMATPHVAGAAVLLRSAFPEATTSEIKYALYSTAVDLGDSLEDNTYGAGRIDVVAAYQSLLLIRKACTSNSNCDDGKACNGAETCNTTTGLCEYGSPLCAGDKACDETSDTCKDVTAPTNPRLCGFADATSPLALLVAAGALAFALRRRTIRS
jgi:subtilisin family serine protease